MIFIIFRPLVMPYFNRQDSQGCRTTCISPGLPLLIVYASYIISFLYNIVALACNTGLLSPVVAAILMPLSSISVVTFASISVSVLSKARKF